MTEREGNVPTPSGQGEGDREAQLRLLGHDLRNHLYVIGLSISVLRKRMIDQAELQELINKLEEEQKQAVQVLDEVLRLARQEED